MVDLNAWLKEAKADASATKCGMYLTHNGVVRETARAKVHDGNKNTAPIKGMKFSYDEKLVKKAIEETYKFEGIYYIKTWLATGELKVGDDIMFVMIGGDIRPHVVAALQFLVSKIKNECVKEEEIY